MCKDDVEADGGTASNSDRKDSRVGLLTSTIGAWTPYLESFVVGSDGRRRGRLGNSLEQRPKRLQVGLLTSTVSVWTPYLESFVVRLEGRRRGRLGDGLEQRPKRLQVRLLTSTVSVWTPYLESFVVRLEGRRRGRLGTASNSNRKGSGRGASVAEWREVAWVREDGMQGEGVRFERALLSAAARGALSFSTAGWLRSWRAGGMICGIRCGRRG